MLKNMEYNELIEKLKEFGNYLNKSKEQIEEFQKQLESFKADEEKKFKRVKLGKIYYSINLFKGKFVCCCIIEENSLKDNYYFSNNNYFLTKERAQEVADKLNHFMRIERLHDELCLDYRPNWQDKDETKWIIYYDAEINYYLVDDRWVYKDVINTYFPTKEIAKKACDILNAELKRSK